MNRELERIKMANAFSNDVLQSVGCDGSQNPYKVLRLIYGRLTDGEAGNLLSALQKRGRDSHRWRPELLASLVIEEWGKRERERDDIKMAILNPASKPKPMLPSRGFEECIATVAGRIGRSTDAVKNQLKKLEGTNAQLERMKKR
jgi:hypothetical protein